MMLLFWATTYTVQWDYILHSDNWLATAIVHNPTTRQSTITDFVSLGAQFSGATWWGTINNLLSCRLQGALCENTSSTKVTGTVLALYCHRRTTEPWPQVMYRKFSEVCTHGFWHMQADRPTDRYADTLTAILCTLRGGEGGGRQSN